MAWRLFHGIEVRPLDVLNQGHLHAADLLDVADDGRNLAQLGHAGRAPAALACDNGIALAVRRKDDRLDHAHGPDRGRELIERLGRELFARLVFIGINAPDGDHLDAVFRVLLVHLGNVAKQRVDSLPQATARLRHVISLHSTSKIRLPGSHTPARPRSGDRTD